ncbi:MULTISPECIES: hypothetical protein [unclassified Bradyrhizobium]|uniref:hypothetical protein n=1 Tax=unclassified Bradyrhizobium TaxID=2631580 RepID=UPI0029164AED|nr:MULTISPECIES: hypothetical protein [unclassified Bradyrhizobium]
MGYAALVLAILGLAAGLTSRLKILLVHVAIVFLLSIGFSLQAGFTFLWTAAIVMIAQTILQSSYLAGLVIRAVLRPAQFPAFDDASDAPAGERSVKAFDRLSKIPRSQRPFAQGIVRGQLWPR